MEKEHKHSSSHESHGKKPEGVISSMPPKFAFWAGVITAVAVISVIGFAIMLTLTLKGVDSTDDASTTNTNTAATNTNTNTAAKTAAASTSIDTDLLTHVKGEGDITLVEFSDPECPYCQQFHGTLKEVLEGDYSGKVRWGFIPFPLEGLHPTSPKETEAAECAADQDKFWDYLNKLFETAESSPALEVADLKTIAGQVGLDESAFADCLDSSEKASTIAASIQQAQSIGGTGTPFSVLIENDGTIITGIKGAQPAENLAAILDNYL